MGKTWVLDTETKGTGANMVPLEKVEQKPAPRAERFLDPARPKAPAPDAPEPRVPRRFKVVDVMTRQVLAEDAGARETLEVLADVRSIVDVNVSVWEPKPDRWRLLTFSEQRLLWDRREPAGAA
jgi:hypothetical protein